MKLFCVLDIKANQFSSIHPCKSTHDALRGFDVVVNDPEKKSNIAQFPDDFALMELGSFDEATGELKALSIPLNLGTGRHLIRQMSIPGVQ